MSSTTSPSLPPFNTIALQQPLTLAGSGLPSTTDGSGDRPLPALSPLVLANRVILASLTRNRAGPADEASRETTDGVPNPEMIEYYRQRARGGFGLLLSEGVLIEPQGTTWRDAPGIWNDAQVAGWRSVTEAVHAEGGQILCQLWHLGRVSHPDQPQQLAFGHPVRAASKISARGGHFHDLPGKPSYVAPTEALADPTVVVDAFRKAAINARRAGFDGVELHSASGYLIVQFLDRSANQRIDGYGGSAANRVRFADEVLQAVLEVWPADRVGIKMAPIGGYNDVGMNALDTVETFGALLAVVSRLELAYVQMVRYLKHEDAVLDPREGLRARCQTLDLERALLEPFRALQLADGRQRPTRVFLNGNFGGLSLAGEEANRFVKEGRADAIVFGRDSICNPDLPYRIFNGIPLSHPGGGPKSTWYAVPPGPGGRGRGLIDAPFSEAFVRERGEGEAIVRA